MPNPARPFDTELPNATLPLADTPASAPMGAQGETNSGSDAYTRAGAFASEAQDGTVPPTAEIAVVRPNMTSAQSQFLRFVRAYIREAEKRGQVREDIVRQLLQLLERESLNGHAARYSR